MAFDPGARITNRIETERAIEAAAVSLVQVQGYAKTTARDIAEAAGTTERTSFRYCPTKVDAFRFGVQWVLEMAGWCVRGQPDFADLVRCVEQSLRWMERTQGHPRRHLMRVVGTMLALRESLSTCARVGETRLAQTFVTTCRRLADSARH